MVTAGYLEHSAAVGNLKLSYQEWGNPNAEPILMLHGFGVSGHMFDEFADRMQDRYRLIALDQRGHGDSDWSEDGDYTRNSFVEDVEGFRKALGLERFILVGHSMGGLNAVTYVNRYPAHVRALVLVDVGPESAKEGVDNIVRFTRGPDELEFEEFVELAHRFNQRRTLENIRERMRHRLKPTENGKYTWKFDKRFREPDSGLRIGGEAANDDSWSLFRGVSVPTLLIRGAESDVLSQPIAERAASEMHRTRLVVVPGAGHSVPGDNPDAFTEAVQDFLGDLERGDFEPSAASYQPPLDQLVDEHSRASRRGTSFVVLVGAGAVAAIALVGVTAAVKKSNNRKKQHTLRGGAIAAAEKVPAISPADIDHARERAVEMVTRLSAVSASRTRRAKKTLSEVDLQAARVAAHDALVYLGETSKTAPSTIRTAADKVDQQELKRYGMRVLRTSIWIGTVGTRALVALVAKKKHKPQHRVARWRN